MHARSLLVPVLVVLVGALICLDWPMLLSGLHAFHLF